MISMADRSAGNYKMGMDNQPDCGDQRSSI
jgi:hypothetical protein